MRLRALQRNPERNCDDEHRASSFAGADGAHRAAMKLDEMTHDRESQAKAAVTARGRRIRLPEAVEYKRQKVGADPFTGVDHTDLRMVFGALQPDFDAAAGRGELDRIGQKIPDHLLQTDRIAHHMAD